MLCIQQFSSQTAFLLYARYGVCMQGEGQVRGQYVGQVRGEGAGQVRGDSHNNFS